MSSAEPQYTWLWCDDNTKVTEWFLSEPDHHEYQFFYSSFINAANRAWSLISFKNAVLQPLDEDMISCLSLNPIPAETLIEVLKKYNRLIGGTRGDLKRKGLIKFGDAPPELAAIEKGPTELSNTIAGFCKRQAKAVKKIMEDGEMKDAESRKEEAAYKFEIAIVGGRKRDEEGDEDMA